jgi:protein-disulfide isomerase
MAEAAAGNCLAISGGEEMRSTPPGHLSAAVNEYDHTRGSADAPATLVVYGDYECPYTRRALAAVAQLREQFGEQLRFVFRNFPLTEIHPHALQAAEAAEAASAQGRFWDMHDYLFLHQRALESSNLLEYASDLGLDTARFEQDLAAHAHIERIKTDVESGLRSGVQGTPTLFINDVLYNASWERDPLGAALRTAIGGASAEL